MVDPLILLLFILSGSAAGWMGIHLLPIGVVNETTDAEQLRLILTASGGGIGLIAGLVFKRLRVSLMQQVRTMPTDLLVSRALGLILGLLVANLLLLPVLLLPFSGGVALVKPLLAVVSNVFFGILGSNLAEVHGRTLLRLFNPASTEANWYYLIAIYINFKVALGNPIKKSFRFLFTRAIEQDDKFISANTTESITITQQTTHSFRELNKRLVSYIVTVFIVNFFEFGLVTTSVWMVLFCKVFECFSNLRTCGFLIHT